MQRLWRPSHYSNIFWNAKISTQTHLIYGIGLVWYKDIIPPKTLNFNFRESHIIGTTMFISSMIDTAFDLPDEPQDSLTLTSTPQRNKSLDRSEASKMDNPRNASSES